MYILGISAFYHDSAAALIRDGKIVAAAQEERFTRKKHDAGYPVNAIEFCLKHAGVGAQQIDYVTYYDKPFLTFERLLETCLAFAPRGFNAFRASMPLWLREKLFLKRQLSKELQKTSPEIDWGSRLLFSEHHLSHAASAFFPSPFNDAAVLTMDGVGEWTTTSLSIGQGNQLSMVKEIKFPHSLGLLYSAFTSYSGFKVNSGEYKLMGLAPYGEPRFTKLITDNLIDIKADGSFRLDMSYFNYCAGLTMTNSRFHKLFGGMPRAPESPLTQKEMDVAASIQQVTEQIVLRLTRSIAKETGMRNICLAGGVALNCVANGKVLRDGQFDNMWVQPASGDAGGAIGSALAAYHIHLGNSRIISHNDLDAMNGAYLGPEFLQEDIENRLKDLGARFEVFDDKTLQDACVSLLVNGKALGWFQGRMEFGPRALGARSIIADARSPDMQSLLNLKIKYRESFRPFAPSVLREDVADWFDLDVDSQYMLFVAEVLGKHCKPLNDSAQDLFGIDKLNIPRSSIPAVTHIDYSARIQTVHHDTNPRYHELLTAFKRRTSCPVLVNTSFNVRGEPIVCTPEDAFRCFMGTEIEGLAIGNCFLRKEEQDKSLMAQYSSNFELD